LPEARTTQTLRIRGRPAGGRGVVRTWKSPGSDDARQTGTTSVPSVDDVESLLRRLALNDEESVGMVLANGSDAATGTALRPKVDLLVQLGALLALGAATTSLRATVRRAIAAGATEAEIVGVLIAVAPAVGLARVVSSAPRLAVAIGYDMEEDE
jgi:alkylhydroperoxidase/carboxymuconolactone decarboxylase family protein YurZ